MSATTHRCSHPVLKPAIGGMTDRHATCGKPATVKSGKRYLCAEHALKEAGNGKRAA